jgi:autotransporter-associated beta strand protein
VGSISTSGLLTASNTSATGPVTATSGTLSGSSTVTVTPYPSVAKWNGATNSLWSTGGNWIDASTGATLAATAAPGVRGVTGDMVLFASAGGSVAQLDANASLAAITFNAPNKAATSYTIEGSGGSITLQGVDGATASVSAGSDTSDTIDAPVQLASNAAFSAAANSTLTMNGPIDGSGSLTMNGNGQLALDAANTFSGGLIVQSGTVVVGAANGLLAGSSLTVGSASEFNRPSIDSAAVAPTNSPKANSAAAVPLDRPTEDSVSAPPATRSLSPRAVAAVMAAGPPMPKVLPWVCRAAAAILSAVPGQEAKEQRLGIEDARGLSLSAHTSRFFGLQ